METQIHKAKGVDACSAPAGDTSLCSSAEPSLSSQGTLISPLLPVWLGFVSGNSPPHSLCSSLTDTLPFLELSMLSLVDSYLISIVSTKISTSQRGHPKPRWVPRWYPCALSTLGFRPRTILLILCMIAVLSLHSKCRGGGDLSQSMSQSHRKV